MISKEKRAEYKKRYKEKHPDKCREQSKKWWDKKKIKELTAKVEAQKMVIAELRQKLEKAEQEADMQRAKAAKLAKEYRRAKRLNGKTKEYLTYCLRGTPEDTILVGLDFIYNNEEIYNDEN